MDYTSELLARLQKGESAENIAAELTKAINDANAQHERLKAEAKDKRKAEKKIAAIDTLLDAFEQIIVAWDLGDAMLDFFDEIEIEEVVQAIDEAMPEVRPQVELVNALSKLREPRSESDEPKKKRCDCGHCSDPIEKFLNECVRSKQ